jgi:hypothetical protein
MYPYGRSQYLESYKSFNSQCSVDRIDFLIDSTIVQTNGHYYRCYICRMSRPKANVNSFVYLLIDSFVPTRIIFRFQWSMNQKTLHPKILSFSNSLNALRQQCQGKTTNSLPRRCATLRCRAQPTQGALLRRPKIQRVASPAKIFRIIVWKIKTSPYTDFEDSSLHTWSISTS